MGREGRLVVVRKATDETVNNSTTLQDDDELFFRIRTGETWAGQLFIYHTDADGTAHFKFAWKAGVSGYHHVASVGVDGITSNQAIAATSAISVFTQAFYVVSFLLWTAAATTAQFQWAQSTAKVANSVVKAESSLVAWKVNP